MPQSQRQRPDQGWPGEANTLTDFWHHRSLVSDGDAIGWIFHDTPTPKGMFFRKIVNTLMPGDIANG